MGKGESLGQGVRLRCLPSECYVPYETQGLRKGRKHFCCTGPAGSNRDGMFSKMAGSAEAGACTSWPLRSAAADSVTRWALSPCVTRAILSPHPQFPRGPPISSGSSRVHLHPLSFTMHSYFEGRACPGPPRAWHLDSHALHSCLCLHSANPG